MPFMYQWVCFECVACVCVRLAVCAIRRAFAFPSSNTHRPLIVHSSTHAASTHQHTQRPLNNTQQHSLITQQHSVTPSSTSSFSLINTIQAGFWVQHSVTYKKLSASIPVNKWPPRLSLINLNKKLARKCLFWFSSFHWRNNCNE
jgi:cytoskeletal protein RodZ